MAVRSALINVMAKAAEKAGKNLRRDFGEIEQLQVSRKGPADFVSNADHQAQKIIHEELSKARPEFGFVGEEGLGAPGDEKKPERWIVDPLDGTTNFLHGLAHWAVSIAAVRGNEVIAGLIYDPIKDEMFWAEKGLGSYLNNKRLRVSARRDLSECLIATGLPFKGVMDNDPNWDARLNAIVGQVSGIRRYGAASLDLAYVAAGRYDGYWEAGCLPWDLAAGAVVVKEAGGFVSPYNPKEDPIDGEGIIATNDRIHDELTRILRSV